MSVLNLPPTDLFEFRLRKQGDAWYIVHCGTGYWFPSHKAAKFMADWLKQVGYVDGDQSG